MPMYNYNCSSCGIIFEELVSGEYYKEPQEHDECGNLCDRTAEGQEVYAHGIGLKEHSRDSGSQSRRKVEDIFMVLYITAKVLMDIFHQHTLIIK